MSLYNLRSADGDWRITKFDNDLNVESSYLVSTDACECPAGHRPSCRHRQMLPRMLAAQAEDSPMFYDFDHDTWLVPEGTAPEILNAEPMADGQIFDANDNIVSEALTEGASPLEHYGKPAFQQVTEQFDSSNNPTYNNMSCTEIDEIKPSTHPQGSIRRRL